MTKEELQVKLNDAEVKVEKRIGTIDKLCSKLNVNKELLLNSYREFAKDYSNSYLPSKTSREIVAQFITRLNDRNEVGDVWNSDAYAFNCKIGQLEDNLVKLYEVERVVKNWQVRYDIQKNKEEAPKIEAIWNFLCEWEQKALVWYRKNAKTYFELKRDIEKNKEEYVNSKRLQDQVEFELKYYSSSTPEKVKENLIRDWQKHYYDNIPALTINITNIKCKYVYPNPNNRWEYKYVPDTYEVDEKLLTKTIAQEKLAKYYDLCNRISDVVGEITDASNLSIGNQHGELNGIVIGTKGQAKVETISAGGYNIQCFHYRVLVHRIK